MVIVYFVVLMSLCAAFILVPRKSKCFVLVTLIFYTMFLPFVLSSELTIDYVTVQKTFILGITIVTLILLLYVVHKEQTLAANQYTVQEDVPDLPELDARLRFDLTDNSGRNKAIIECLRMEYEKTQEIAIHYDSLNWNIGAILIGAAVGSVAIAKVIDIYPYIAFASFVLLYMWFRFYWRHRALQQVKFKRLHQIETLLGLRQHLHVKREEQLRKLPGLHAYQIAWIFTCVVPATIYCIWIFQNGPVRWYDQIMKDTMRNPPWLLSLNPVCFHLIILAGFVFCSVLYYVRYISPWDSAFRQFLQGK